MQRRLNSLTTNGIKGLVPINITHALVLRCLATITHPALEALWPSLLDLVITKMQPGLDTQLIREGTSKVDTR